MFLRPVLTRTYILILTRLDISLSVSLGIKKKLIGQMKAFEELGFKAALVARYESEMHLLQLQGDSLATVQTRVFKSRLERLATVLSLCRPCFKNVYYRYAVGDIVSAAVVAILRLAGRRIYTEFPTYPYGGEFDRSVRHRFLKQLDKLSLRAIRFASTFFVNCSSPDPIARKSTIFLQNGVDITVPPCKAGTALHPRRFVFVGNLSSWQGVDRIIRSFIELVNDEPGGGLRLTVVGDGPELEKLRALVSTSGHSNAIYFTGPLEGENLQDELATQDVAFSSSAIDRKGMTRLSAIKTSEYAANGLPFVLNYEDANFPDSRRLPFVIRMEDHAVDVRRAIQLYEGAVEECADLHQLARKYAESHLSWTAKMRPIAERISGHS